MNPVNAQAPQPWTESDAREWLTPPVASDQKYSRGVVTFATGSAAYPGAAVLGVDAALHTGVGAVRYVGPESVGRLVLERRPEVVLGEGTSQVWVAGSGTSVDDEDAAHAIDGVVKAGARLVLDAGAIGRAGEAFGPTIITPHAGELATLLGVDRLEVEAEPIANALRAADETGAVVLLKGSTTIVTDGSRVVSVAEGTPWLATAGAGDALAGMLGALIAVRAGRDADSITEDALVSLGATAAFLHGRAARAAAGEGTGGPFTILELNAAVPGVVRGLLVG